MRARDCQNTAHRLQQAISSAPESGQAESMSDLHCGILLQAPYWLRHLLASGSSSTCRTRGEE